MNRPHINADGEFQSDKYPSCPPGKVPLSVKDKTAQPLLWQYAQIRRAVDAEFAADLEYALKQNGYEPHYTADSIRTDGARMVRGVQFDEVCADLRVLAAERDTLRQLAKSEGSPSVFCPPCNSYHVVPRDEAQHRILMCLAPWNGPTEEDWADMGRAVDEQLAKLSPEELAEMGPDVDFNYLAVKFLRHEYDITKSILVRGQALAGLLRDVFKRGKEAAKKSGGR